MIQNLVPAKALGMTTIWVDNGSELGSHNHDEAHYDERIASLLDWLERITGRNA